MQHPPSLKKHVIKNKLKKKELVQLKQSPLDVVSETSSIRTVFLHDVVLNLIEGSLGSRCDRRGPHSIVAGNVSSDSIPGVLGIVSPVKSTFGGWLVG